MLKQAERDEPLQLYRSVSSISEECPKCGSAISEETLKRELKPALELKRKQQSYVSLSCPSSPLLPFPSFQTADEISSRLTFNIDKLDSILNLEVGETVGILGYASHVQLFLTRLFVRALLSERHGGFNSPNVITIDAGNCSDIYQCVSFARQYGLNIKNVLQRIIVSRPFTIYQLAHLIINELPNTVQKFDTRLVVISDLLKMFAEDPQLNANEAKMLLRQITSSIKKTLFLNKNSTLFLISLPYHSHNQSLEYYKILFPRFDKYIEITKEEEEADHCLLEIKMLNRSEKQQHSKISLSEKELMVIPNR